MDSAEIEEPQKKIRRKSIKVRFNEHEYEQMLKRQSGNTTAGWLRQVALGIVPIYQADSDLVRNIGRIGSNLNQIARYLNEYGIPYNALSGEVRAAVSDLAALKFEVLKVIGEAYGNDKAYQF